MSNVSSSSACFRWPIRVYYEDTDAGGVVYHATYLKFMERARTEWLRHLGFEQDALREEQGLIMVVRRMDLRFVSPARFNDALVVETSVSSVRRASLEFEQRVLRAEDKEEDAATSDGSPRCAATVNLACVTWPGMRPSRIPSSITHAIDQQYFRPESLS